MDSSEFREDRRMVLKGLEGAVEMRTGLDPIVNVKGGFLMGL